MFLNFSRKLPDCVGRFLGSSGKMEWKISWGCFCLRRKRGVYIVFCSKCGNPLQDDAKFCGACGAPVKTAEETAPVPQRSAGITDETVNVQTPKPEPLMAAQNFSVQMNGGDVTSVQKKSKKGLIIGLSAGGVLLVVVTAVILVALGLFNPASSTPFPILEAGQTQIFYGEDFDQLEEDFPNMENTRTSTYVLKRSENQCVACYVRTDKETGETRLVLWMTTMNHTGIVNGISMGDSYERILEEYPDAMCSTETRPNNPSKYNPETDSIVYFTVYMDENGNTYSYTEYDKKRADSFMEHENFDLAQWYALDFTVENGQITRIDFGDLMALQQGH